MFFVLAEPYLGSECEKRNGGGAERGGRQRQPPNGRERAAGAEAFAATLSRRADVLTQLL